MYLQRGIQNPFKHLRWRLLQSKPTTCSCFFGKKSISWMFNMVLQKPLHLIAQMLLFYKKKSDLETEYDEIYKYKYFYI